MAEYIEHSAAIEAAKHAWAKGLEPSQYIEALPAADVAPVVHGRWVHGYYCYEPATQCSVCKVCLAKGHRAEKQFTYCPNCGAKMDGGTT